MSDANSKNTEPNEFAGLIGTFTKYGTLLVGGLCLLMYSNEIGQFPEGMGIGEGLAFYLVCAVASINSVRLDLRRVDTAWRGAGRATFHGGNVGVLHLLWQDWPPL